MINWSNEWIDTDTQCCAHTRIHICISTTVEWPGHINRQTTMVIFQSWWSWKWVYSHHYRWSQFVFGLHIVRIIKYLTYRLDNIHMQTAIAIVIWSSRAPHYDKRIKCFAFHFKDFYSNRFSAILERPWDDASFKQHSVISCCYSQKIFERTHRECVVSGGGGDDASDDCGSASICLSVFSDKCIHCSF